MKNELKQIFSVYHPNGFDGNVHTHANHEIVYCLEGNGYVDIQGKRMKFSTGNYYVIHSGTPHSEHDNRAARIIYFFFDAPSEDIREGTYTDYKGNVSSVVKQLYEESKQSLPQKETMIHLLISQLLLESQRASCRELDRQDFSWVLQYISENIEQPLDFQKLAEQYNYSYDRFRHLFKERVGMPLHQYVLQQRIEKAKFLLSLNPNNPLTEIAFECGFTSSSQFSNIFLAKTGMTPTRYIESLKS
jgi:AraC family transcriptional activator of pobA